ncbi:hypothetical protein [Flavobacterium psychrotolerans]|uniref:hypothetical protein n=1 Tax=Flavobacterium psychrotolerans TaxID=2169410 RepID=UPI0011AB4DEE|nr:hypothetical protein [Flavobacterium psychrotolerans]
MKKPLFPIKIFKLSYPKTKIEAFTDGTYLWNKEKYTVIAGLNLLYDNFKEKDISNLDSKSFTTGAYVQHTWDVSENIKLENGLRIDNVNYSNPNF